MARTTLIQHVTDNIQDRSKNAIHSAYASGKTFTGATLFGELANLNTYVSPGVVRIADDIAGTKPPISNCAGFLVNMTPDQDLEAECRDIRQVIYPDSETEPSPYTRVGTLADTGNDHVWGEWTTLGGNNAPLPMIFEIPNREDMLAMHFAIEFHETDDYSGTPVYNIDTALSQTGVKVLDGTAWVAFPAGGAGTLFYGNPIKVEYNVLMRGAPKNVRYKLYPAGDDPTAQPWKYTTYPAVIDVNNAVAIHNGAATAHQTLFNAKAPLVSPALTGTPTAPTPASGDNSTKLATTAFVADAVGGVVMISSGTGWREYSDGRLDQWGLFASSTTYSNTYVTFPRAFRDTETFIVMTPLFNGKTDGDEHTGAGWWVSELTTTGFNARIAMNVTGWVSWYARGIGA